MPIALRPLSILFATSCFCLVACSKRDEGSDMRTTTTTHETSVAGLVTTKSETTTTEPVSPTETGPDEDAAQPQAGLLTAGDHDDLLNSGLYAKYAGRFLQAHAGKLLFVDTRTRVAVHVLDSAGRAVPFARLDIQRPGSPLHLVAAADGSASVYPSLDR